MSEKLLSQALRLRYFVLAHLAIFSIAILVFVADPVVMSQLIGAPALLQFFLANCVAAAAFFRWAGLVPTVAVLVLLIVRLFWGEIDHPFRHMADASDRAWAKGDHSDLENCNHPTVNCAFQDWLRNRPDLNSYAERGIPYPVYLVSAEGGGIYAAAHTYATLEHASLACPNFRQHIFSISGVSGGAMGAAVYAADKRFNQRIETVEACKPVDEGDGRRKRPLSRDFFSTVVPGFIFGNVTEFLLPFDLGIGSSGEFLEDAFLAVGERNFLASSVREYWRPEGNDPALFFNTTNVQTGRTELIAPFPSERHEFARQNEASDRVLRYWFDYPVSIVTAASLAARFPFITPSGVVPVELSNLESRYVEGDRYVDGGYYENSGAAASLEIDREIRTQKYRSEYRPWCEPTALFSCSNYTDVSFTCPKERHPSLVGLPEPSDHRLQSTGCELDLWRQGVIPISIYHIVIFADYSPVDETPEPSSQRFIDPLTTLLATRVSRGRDAIIDLKAAICQYSGKGCHGMEPYQEQVLEFEISAQSLGLPLSWSLGKVGYTKVVTAVASNFNRGLPHSKCEYARQDEHGCWFVDTEKQLALEYALTGYRPN